MSTPEVSSYGGWGATPMTNLQPDLTPGRNVSWFGAASASAVDKGPLLNGDVTEMDEEEPFLPGDDEGEEQINGGVTVPPSRQVVPQRYHSLLHGCVFGIILSIVLLPMITAFAYIVFKGDFFEPYLPSLVRHVFLSCAVQQFVMSSKSTLPFAIGQVQDIGLYFMATMAERAIDDQRSDHPDRSDDFIMGGVLFILTFATVFVGVLLILVGAFRLARLVQYVPLPVVGGYLGYIGYFLMISGFCIAADVKGESLKSYADLFDVEQEWWNSNLFKTLVTAACVAFIHLVVSFIKHPVSLPAVLTFIPIVYYTVLFVSGGSFEDARRHGWIQDPPGGSDNTASFSDVWRLGHIEELPNYLDLIPKHMKTIIPLFFLVAFGSCLDVAAIQQDYTKDIDYDRELTTIGYQNTVAGCCFAGYTGSYIFSSTVFAMRNGVDHRIAGYIVSFLEFLLFFLPISPLSYVPGFYLGSLVGWIGYGIFMDWMVHAHGKVSRTEFVLIWVTFICVLASELTIGLLIGALISMICFIFSYARSNIAEVLIIPSKRCIVKTVDQRTVLEKFHNNWMAVKLSGYIFFGSAVNIGRNLVSLALAQREKLKNSLDECEELVQKAIVESPLVLILDMRQVKGLDATAARTLGAVRRSLAAEGIDVFITNLHDHQESIYRLLQSHQAILVNGDVFDLSTTDAQIPTDTECPTGLFFTSTDVAVSYCERIFLNSAVKYGLCRKDSASLTLTEVLRSHLHTTPRPFVNILNDYRTMSAAMNQYVTEGKYETGHELFHIGDPSDELFILKKGKISLETSASENRHFLEFGPGGVFGETDFYLNRPRSFNAIVSDNCEVWIITREQFDRMVGAAPSLAICLQLLVLRSSSLSAATALQLLERAHNAV